MVASGMNKGPLSRTPSGDLRIVGCGEEGYEWETKYLALAVGAHFLPGTKHVPGELRHPLGTFSPANLNHPQLLQVHV